MMFNLELKQQLVIAHPHYPVGYWFPVASLAAKGSHSVAVEDDFEVLVRADWSAR